MNAEPDPRKVEECGDRRRLDDVNVGNADELRHEECRRAHDRRHELSARGRRRLDRPRKVRVVAEFFHHRDGERARADNICDRAARDRAHQSTGEDGDLRRTAARPARNRIGEVDEELAEPRALKIGTEKDEEEDKRRGDAERDTEDALRRKVEVPDQLLRRESAMREHARHVGAEEGIRDKGEHDRHHRQPHDAPRRLDDEEDAESADDGVHGRDRARARDQLTVLNDEIGGCRRTENGEYDVDRMKVVIPRPRAPKGIEEIGERESEAEVDGALQLCIEHAEDRRIKLKDRKRNGDRRNDLLRPACIVGGIGLTVVLFEYLFRICRMVCHRGSHP